MPGRGESEEMKADEPVRVMRFANRVPLLYMAGGCAISKAVTGTKWKNYGLQQPRGALPIGPMVIMVHMASVWVPFTSESKEAVAHYPEIIKEMTFALQECGRRLSVYINKRKRQAEAERKHDYIVKYIPHLALGLKEVLELSDRQESAVVKNLSQMLERSHLDRVGPTMAKKKKTTKKKASAKKKAPAKKKPAAKKTAKKKPAAKKKTRS